MTNTMENYQAWEAAETQITNILKFDYDVGTAVAPVEAILWAAEQCDNPRESLAAANRLRTRYGAPLAYAPYGHPAF